jgi:peptidylprolyl isomerase
MNPPILIRFLLALAVAALPAAAQTSSSPAPEHHATAATTHHTAAHEAGCVLHPPEVSSKIPLLAAGSPCVRALYTVTRIPTTRLDYASPLLSPDVREALGSQTETYSLDYVDTKIGTGPLAAEHDYFTVKYTGYLESEGSKFDSSDDHPNKEPITFPYGMHRVIPGWDTGFEGMHVGGKRRIFIPWELAYGENGRPPVIPAKSNLVFDVELVSQSATPPPPPQRPHPPAEHGAEGDHGPTQAHPPVGAPIHPMTAPPTGATPPPQGASTTAQPQSSTPPAGTAAAPKPQR